jgi:hypothetical protein
MEDIREFIRIANTVNDELLKLRKDRRVELLRRLAGLAAKFQELARDSRKMGVSLARGWFTAAESCCWGVRRALGEISCSISQIQPLAEGPRKERPKPSVLVEELKQLQQEFGDVDFDDEQNSLSVVTEPVTLDDLYLGPFQIQLELDKLSRLYDSSPYSVVALDPHPATTDEDVTHPHVRDERLCEGDGSAAIKAALEQGRLCDFFTMVRSILNTYASNSPYVSIAEWDGTPCYECGYIMGSEDGYYCSHCENDFCEQCSTCCQSCGEVFCLQCAGQCNQCERTVCRSCVLECAKCGELFCTLCLEEDVCENCKQESEVEENEEQRESKDGTDNQAKDKAKPQTNEESVKLAG